MTLARRLKINVVVVFPRPCKILLKVVERNKKGQIQPRVVIKVPAREFRKMNSPIKCPDKRKTNVLIRPRIIQDSMVFFIVLKIRVWFFCSYASETAGKSITATEPVKTLGKRIMGSAMPVKMPKTLKASEVV